MSLLDIGYLLSNNPKPGDIIRQSCTYARSLAGGKPVRQDTINLTWVYSPIHSEWVNMPPKITWCQLYQMHSRNQETGRYTRKIILLLFTILLESNTLISNTSTRHTLSPSPNIISYRRRQSYQGSVIDILNSILSIKSSLAVENSWNKNKKTIKMISYHDLED